MAATHKDKTFFRAENKFALAKSSASSILKEVLRRNWSSIQPLNPLSTINSAIQFF